MRNERSVDERPQAAPARGPQRTTDADTPCFRIDHIALNGLNHDPFVGAPSATDHTRTRARTSPGSGSGRDPVFVAGTPTCSGSVDPREVVLKAYDHTPKVNPPEWLTQMQ